MKCENCLHYGACLSNSEYVPTPCREYENKADCRKQSAGEWVTNAWDGKKWIIIPYKKHEHIGAHCSVCNKRALLNYDKDEVTSNFCPNCGAKMKGGE